MQRLGRGLRVVNTNIPRQKDAIGGLRKHKHVAAVAAKKPNKSAGSNQKHIAADDTQVHSACQWSNWANQVDECIYKDFSTEQFGADCVPERANTNRIELVRLIGDVRSITCRMCQ